MLLIFATFSAEGMSFAVVTTLSVGIEATMNFSKLFISGHKEIKRPMNPVDDGLLQRMEEASRRLRARGKEVKAVMGPKASAPAVDPQPLRAVGGTHSDDRMVARILDRSVPAKVAELPRAHAEAKATVAMKRAS
jgi:hypothetical protein